MPVESVPMTGGFGGMMVFFAIGVGLLTCIVHFAFALGILVDAGKQDQAKRLFFATEWVWFFATLIGGVFVAAAYWVIHHSRLNPVISFGEMSQVQDSK